MRYADGPSVEVETHVDAPPAVVWALISDVTVPALFSSELQEVTPVDATTFRGRNRHPAAGEWETTCTIVTNEPEATFEWAVGDPDNPSARWRFSMERDATGTRLRQWMRLGPAPSGLTRAIAAMPDKEERIVARRVEEHRVNMEATVEGIRRLAEERAAGGDR
ncbi:MAG TPA: SRPBCC family protein [Acidimicrobiales bacterium]|nr:SRPBCC family protein [Acidimicrobiales bacterium]